MKKRIYSLIFVLLMAGGASASDLQLEVIGSSVASNLYLTYISLGVLGDSYSKEVYDKKQTVDLVNVVVAQSKVQKDYMSKLLQSGEVTDADKEFLKNVAACYQYLVDEGTYMAEFINTNSEASLKKYDASRQNAWALISKLLGLDKK